MIITRELFYTGAVAYLIGFIVGALTVYRQFKNAIKKTDLKPLQDQIENLRKAARQ